MTANKTFHEKLLAVQAKIKQPKFNKRVNYKKKSGQIVDFEYSDLSGLYEAVKEILTTEGLTIVHYINYLDSKVFVTTIIRDQTENIRSEFPLSIEGLTMQQIGEQITYIKRYELAGLLAIAGEEDTDAKGLIDQPMKAETISIKQVLELEDILDGNEVLLGKLLKKEKISTLTAFPLSKFDACVRHLNMVKQNRGV